MVIFDSSILIDVLRGRKEALEIIESYFGEERIAITVLGKYEILRGAESSEAQFASDLLRQFCVLDFNDSAVAEMVKAYKKLVRKGKMVNELDLLVVGIASANNETLVTKDRDFLNFESKRIRVV